MYFVVSFIEFILSKIAYTGRVIVSIINILFYYKNEYITSKDQTSHISGLNSSVHFLHGFQLA